MATTPIPARPPGEPPSNVQSAPNLVHFDPKAVVPSQPIYVQRNDSILIVGITNTAATKINFAYRYLTPDGEIKEGQFSSPPFFPILDATFTLYEGWIISFLVSVLTAPLPGSWTFAQAVLARGGQGGSPVTQSGVIWQGYLENVAGEGWPGTVPKQVTDGPGTLRSVVGTTPAAGADINEVVPGHARWSLLAFTASLTTSATVANRNVQPIIDDSANVFYKGPSYVNQAASTVTPYTFFNNPSNAAVLAGSVPLAVPIPIGLRSTYRIRTLTANLQAADQWTAPLYLIYEWGLWDA